MHSGGKARVFMALIVGLTLVFSTASGRVSAEPGGLELVWYDANYGQDGAYYKSSSPINVSDAVYGSVAQVFGENGLTLSAERLTTGPATGSGVAFKTGLTVKDLNKIAVLADFQTGGTGVFNLFFDLNGDGEFFTFDDSGKMVTAAPDNYALCESKPSDGRNGFIIDEDTRFNIMGKGGVHTLRDIADGNTVIPQTAPVGL